MDWQGLDPDASIVGPVPVVADNVSFRVRGELRRRPGLGTRIAQTGINVGLLRDPQLGDFLVFLTDTGTLESAAVP